MVILKIASTTTFSAGICFRYWSWQTYKNRTPHPHLQRWNIRNYSGYDSDKLHIDAPIYKDIKEEILESGYVNIKTYNEILVIKAQNYINSIAIKSLKPNINSKHHYGNNNNHYGITKKKNSKVTFGQLSSLICYCDLTDFSRIWSSTFRPIEFDEPLEEIKRRNQKFYFCSKYFIEIVNVFGISGKKSNKNGMDKGPYFCGLAYPLSFPSYNIRLTAPCSVSKQLSVAIRFSGQEGVILKVNNYDKGLHFFNCSWISQYKEEEERVFIAGNIPIKIENITMVETGKQYSRLVRVLSAFDDILHGISNNLIDHSSLTIGDIKYLHKLLEFMINNNNNNNN